MLQTIPIKCSGEIRYIDRFEELVTLASVMKTQQYYLDPITNKIYGFYFDFHSIIETNIPFRINVPLFYEGSILTPETRALIHNTKSFFYSTEYPYILFSENRRADFINGNLSFTFGDKDYGFGVIDNMTGRYAEDCIVLVNPDNWYLAERYKYVLNSYYARLPYLGIPQVFKTYQNDSVTIEVLNNKVAEGTKLSVVRFITPDKTFKTYGFYLFKSLIAPFTRTDSMDLYIQDDMIEPGKFMATFRVIKRNKLKVKIPELDDFYNVDTHVFMFNLA